jgi:outer membrane lipoprotein-sorting protein
MKTIAAFIFSAVAVLAADLQTADEVIANVMEQDHARQANIGAYSVTSKYVLQNKNRHAEMVVRWTRQADGVKEFVILSEQGDGGVRKHVFHRLLEAEVEASRPEQQVHTRITPDNYSFQLAGAEKIDGHEAFVIELEPKTQNKYLTRGRIWVDACDFAVMRVEGAPAHKVSFWTKDVNFVQTFEKNGDWWVPASNHSLTDARLFGRADLMIEYSDYEFGKQVPAGAELTARTSIR